MQLKLEENGRVDGMDFVAKYFQELTTVELYEILKARAQVFVVEQRCV